MKTKVLIAGIGGGCLGMELAKCFASFPADYEVFGCDIDSQAYGRFCKFFTQTRQLIRDQWLDDLTQFCRDQDIHFVFPGGEEPLRILTNSSNCLMQLGIRVCGNSPDLIKNYGMDKRRLQWKFKELGFDQPEWEQEIYPCILKPALDSGGSSNVFVAENYNEKEAFARWFENRDIRFVVQAYVPGEEYTVGVLTGPVSGEVISVCALRRVLSSKLSCGYRNNGIMISTGISQGEFQRNPPSTVIDRCIEISKAFGSIGPMNIQGRLNKEGAFVPFEINFRFSASVYLRCLAKVTEPVLFLKDVNGEKPIKTRFPKPGFAVRGLSEFFITRDPCTA